MAVRSRREKTINPEGLNVLDLLRVWHSFADGRQDLKVGPEVAEALDQAIELRRRVKAKEPIGLALSQPGEVADVLHAVCRVLTDECEESPREVLEHAATIESLIEKCTWPEDELDERRGLLCTLHFICWRSARIAGHTHDALRWETQYRLLFRGSLDWDVVQARLGSRSLPADLIRLGPEATFQALFCLQEQTEANPEAVAETTQNLYHSLKEPDAMIPSDLQLFFLGESARLRAAVLRLVGHPSEAELWAGLAERHFLQGVDPRPSLERLAYVRLAALYEQGRCSLVLRGAPLLDRSFADLGMEEDRVKCRLLWSVSLKLLGRCEEALKVLEPVRGPELQVPPSLRGWVLMHSGDMRQMCGDYDLALEELTEAAQLLRTHEQLTGLADVNAMISSIYRAHGRFLEALELLKRSQDDHARLGMAGLAANNRLMIAETYLAMGRPREAELEVRAALPVFEDQGIVADAVVAINLLREAIRQQRLDPQKLREARDRLRPKK